MCVAKLDWKLRKRDKGKKKVQNCWRIRVSVGCDKIIQFKKNLKVCVCVCVCLNVCECVIKVFQKIVDVSTTKI